jgi:hypothetical protein
LASLSLFFSSLLTCSITLYSSPMCHSWLWCFGGDRVWGPRDWVLRDCFKKAQLLGVLCLVPQLQLVL